MFVFRSQVCYWATFPRNLVPSCYKTMLPLLLFSVYSTSPHSIIQPLFHSTFLWPAVVSSFPLLPLLSLSPAAYLLLSHLQEEDPLLLLAEGLQHLGVHPHVFKDFCQHLASFPRVARDDCQPLCFSVQWVVFQRWGMRAPFSCSRVRFPFL